MLGKETALNSEGFHLLYPLPLRESETHLTAVDVGTGWAHENITFFFFFLSECNSRGNLFITIIPFHFTPRNFKALSETLFFFFFNVSHRFRRKGLVGLAERLMTVSKAHAVARELRLILLSNH